MSKKEEKNITNFHLKIIIFTSVIYHSIFYWRVIVMIAALCKSKKKHILFYFSLYDFRSFDKSEDSSKCSFGL